MDNARRFFVTQKKRVMRISVAADALFMNIWTGRNGDGSLATQNRVIMQQRRLLTDPIIYQTYV